MENSVEIYHDISMEFYIGTVYVWYLWKMSNW